MGIHDRDYARVKGGGVLGGGPVGRAGIGGHGAWYNVRGWTTTGWLVALNIAIALLGVGLVMLPGDKGWVAWPTRVEWGPNVTDEMKRAAASDPNFSKQRLKEAPGNWAVVPLYDVRTGELIGRAAFTAMTQDKAWGHFSTFQAFGKYEVWRFVSFQFLHSGWVHLIFNMVALWTFGPDVEEYLGRKRYLALYLVCGICGAVAYLVLNALGNLFPSAGLPGLLIGDTRTPLVGASAGIFGIMLAAAFVVPQRVIDVLYIIPMRTKPAVYLFFGIAVINLLLGSSNAGGEAAHVGGAIAGSYFIRHMYHLRDFFDFFGPSEKDAPSDVDGVLAKIGRDGRASLTPKEEALLRNATAQARGEDQASTGGQGSGS